VTYRKVGSGIRLKDKVETLNLLDSLRVTVRRLKSVRTSEIGELDSRHLGRTETMGVRTLSNRLL